MPSQNSQQKQLNNTSKKHTQILIETTFTLLSRKCPAQNVQQLYVQHAALLLLKSAKRKRSGAAPGLNGLTYVPYKKCTALLKFVVKLGRKIWKKKDIPADWARAYIILLAKSEDLKSLSEFRPIAITLTVGKIFFSVISDRLQFFMIQNQNITRDLQTGFLFGVPACLEHLFTLIEACREPKECH